jgi:ABC-type nitrate/sulfonate/bicarbonate transport system substrate-binding protein
MSRNDRSEPAEASPLTPHSRLARNISSARAHTARRAAIGRRLLAVAACATGGAVGLGTLTASTAGASDTSDAKSYPMKFIWNSPPDVTYLPLLMAIGQLKSQGYNVSTAMVSSATVASETLAANRGQFTSNQAAAEAEAAAKGADIKIILATTDNPTDWVTSAAYKNCSSLTGQPVGVYALTGSSYTSMMDYYFKKYCPKVKPDIVTIPDSGLRAQAMANGKIDGTVLATSDAEGLTTKLAPKTKWNVVSMSKIFPGLADTYLYANGTILKEDPQGVQALLAADLKAVRQLYAHPGKIGGLVKKYFGTGSDAPTPASAVQAAQGKLWYSNGGLDSDGLKGLNATLQVFKAPGNASKLVSGASLKSVLKQIGHSTATPR